MNNRIHKVPRVWSNNELRKFAPLFSGDVVNISGWKDIDKEGNYYKDYFAKANSYTITNFESDKRGYQGKENEIYLDLEKPLPGYLLNNYDVAFNHTTLEHIYNASYAFENICKMSKDVVILVVPFLQQMHSDYGDYWRFTPEAILKMFNNQGLSVAYLNFNDHHKSVVVG